jgi:hypothetical protein
MAIIYALIKMKDYIEEDCHSTLPASRQFETARVLYGNSITMG